MSSRRTANLESTSRKISKKADKPTQNNNLPEELIPEHIIDLTVDSPVMRRHKKFRRAIETTDNDSAERHISHFSIRLNFNPGNNSNVNVPDGSDDTIVIDDSDSIEIESQLNRTAHDKGSCNKHLTIENGDIAAGISNSSSELGCPPHKYRAACGKKQSSCPICLEEFFDSSVQVMTTKCGHLFCETCLKNSIQSRKKCPVCTSSITLKSCIRLYL